MKCRKCGTPAVAPRTPVPQWMDAALVMAGGALRRTVFEQKVDGLSQVVAADPTRYALGFSKGGQHGTIANLSPFPDAFEFPFMDPRNAEFWWFDLFTFGPLVTSAWYTQFFLGNFIVVWECYRTS